MKNFTFLLFGLLLIGISNYSSSQTPLTDENIQLAVDLWLEPSTTADSEAEYGHI